MKTAEIKIMLEGDADKIVSIVDNNGKGMRGKTSVHANGNSLQINIEAEDEKSLLVAMGSVIKQLRVINDVKSIADTSAINDKAINMHQ